MILCIRCFFFVIVRWWLILLILIDRIEVVFRMDGYADTGGKILKLSVFFLNFGLENSDYNNFLILAVKQAETTKSYWSILERFREQVHCIWAWFIRDWLLEEFTQWSFGILGTRFARVLARFFLTNWCGYSLTAFYWLFEPVDSFVIVIHFIFPILDDSRLRRFLHWNGCLWLE